MVIYILTKFGADWLIFVDARLLTRKLWTDVGWMVRHPERVSDHNSSLSTLCLCQPTILAANIPRSKLLSVLASTNLACCLHLTYPFISSSIISFLLYINSTVGALGPICLRSKQLNIWATSFFP